MRDFFSGRILSVIHLIWIAMVMAFLVYPTTVYATHEDEPMNCEGALVDKFQDIDLIAKRTVTELSTHTTVRYAFWFEFPPYVGEARYELEIIQYKPTRPSLVGNRFSIDTRNPPHIDPGFGVLHEQTDGGTIGVFLHSTGGNITSEERFAAAAAETVAAAVGRVKYKDREGHPEAEFLHETNGLTVQFDNHSIHTTCTGLEYEWDFGDGSDHSELKDPEHIYKESGTYTVTLIAREPPPGQSSQTSRQITIEVQPIVDVRFTDNRADGRISLDEEVGISVDVKAPDDSAGFTGLKLVPNFALAPNLEIISGPEPEIPDSFNLPAGKKLTFDWIVKPDNGGKFRITSRVKGESNTGAKVEGFDALEGSVNALSVVFTAIPEMLLLNQPEVEGNEPSERCKVLQDAETGKNDPVTNCVEITATITNTTEATIENVNVQGLTEGLHRGLTLTSLTENIGVPLTFIELEPVAGTENNPKAVDLEPEESTTVTWRLEAFDGPAKIRLRTLVTGGDSGTGATVTTLGEDEYKIIENVLLRWGMKVGRDQFVSGATVPLQGVLENVTSEEVDPQNLLVLMHRSHDGNLGGGHAYHAQDSEPNAYKLFKLAPGEKLDFKAQSVSIRASVNTTAKSKYGVRLWVLDEEGKAVNADDQAVLYEEGEFVKDTFEFIFAKNEIPVQNPFLECGYPAWWCASVVGSENLIGGFIDIGKFLGKTAIDTGNYSYRYSIWHMEMLKTGMQATLGDKEAKDKLTQEIVLDLQAAWDAGLITSEQGVDLTVAVSQQVAKSFDEFIKTMATGTSDEIEFMITKFAVENIDMVFESLVAVKSIAKAGRRMLDTNSTIGRAIARQETKRAEDLAERLARAEADGVSLEKAFAAGDELSPNILRKVYGVTEDTIDYLKFVAKEENVVITFRSRNPISIDLIKNKLAWPKPQSIKFKTLNDIDIQYLGYRNKPGIVELVEPPPNLVGKTGNDLSAELELYVQGLSSKHPELLSDKVLRAEVKGRLKTRVEEWTEYVPELDGAVKEGLPTNFEPGAQFANGTSHTVGADELRKVTKELVEGPDKTRKYYEIKMSDPSGGDLRAITGDIDFLAILNPDGTFILDEIKRINIYRRLRTVLDMQHGESFSYFLSKVRKKNLECCVEGKGSAMVAIGPDGGSPRAAFFADNLSVLEGGPNIIRRLADPTGDFILLRGMNYRMKSNLGVLGRVAIRTFNEAYSQFLLRFRFFLPSYISRQLIGENGEAEFSRDSEAPILQATTTGFRVWTEEQGWRDIGTSEAIELGGAGVADMKPMTSMPLGANQGDTQIEITEQNELGATGTFFQPGDKIVINPGGDNQEFGIVKALGSIILEEPLRFDHNSGEAIFLVSAAQTFSDSDNDGIPDNNDVFPNNPNESVDTDNDGIGNNADLDDDNDGFSDVAEIAAGSDPLDSNSRPQNQPIGPNEPIPTLSQWMIVLLAMMLLMYGGLAYKNRKRG